MVLFLIWGHSVPSRVQNISVCTVTCQNKSGRFASGSSCQTLKGLILAFASINWSRPSSPWTYSPSACRCHHWLRLWTSRLWTRITCLSISRSWAQNSISTCLTLRANPIRSYSKPWVWRICPTRPRNESAQASAPASTQVTFQASAQATQASSLTIDQKSDHEALSFATNENIVPTKRYLNSRRVVIIPGSSNWLFDFNVISNDVNVFCVSGSSQSRSCVVVLRFEMPYRCCEREKASRSPSECVSSCSKSKPFCRTCTRCVRSLSSLKGCTCSTGSVESSFLTAKKMISKNWPRDEPPSSSTGSVNAEDSRCQATLCRTDSTCSPY